MERFKAEVAQVEQEYYSQAPGWILELNSEVRKVSANQTYYIAQTHQGQGIKTTQLSVLEYLLKKGGCAQITGLSREFYYTKQALSATLNSMEERGLLERIMDPMDKRKRLLQLTSAGLDCVREILMEREESLGKVVAALTEEEAREATRILKKLNDFYMAHLPNR